MENLSGKGRRGASQRPLAPESRGFYGHFFKRGGHAPGLPAIVSNGPLGECYDPPGLVPSHQ